ncbi:serine/threonine-protein kinase haspin-like [Centruroides vittatus]|uniref:serine/threonine-protein kinase haspin-like n=1 Tax=Centruroides vittatus TaxID=120091 RepID=UPI003510BAB2
MLSTLGYTNIISVIISILLVISTGLFKLKQLNNMKQGAVERILTWYSINDRRYSILKLLSALHIMSTVNEYNYKKKILLDVIRNASAKIAINYVENWWIKHCARLVMITILKERWILWIKSLLIQRWFRDVRNKNVFLRTIVSVILIIQLWYRKEKLKRVRHLTILQERFKAVLTRISYLKLRRKTIYLQASTRKYLNKKYLDMKLWIFKNFNTEIWLSIKETRSEKTVSFINQCSEVRTSRSSSMLSVNVPFDRFNITDLMKRRTKYYNLVLKACNQINLLTFSQVIPENCKDECWKKLGEGSYGNVYAILDEWEIPFQIFKVVPVSGFNNFYGKQMEHFETVYPEIIASLTLSSLSDDEMNRTSGFARINRVSCVTGPFPKYLCKAWDIYHLKYRSRTKYPGNFPSNQMYIIYDMKYEGQQILSSNLQPQQVCSIIKQVSCSIAVAESAANFEHRDLHLGNVLIKKTMLSSIPFRLNGEKITIDSYGIAATIIDYTFSRIGQRNKAVYRDLSRQPFNRNIIEHKIYRKMREYNNDDWSVYWPYSNVMWLWYLNACLVKKLEKSLSLSPNIASEDIFLTQLNYWKKCLLSQDSVTTFVTLEFLR